MSIQPLITASFSSIYTPPAPYGARRSATIGDTPVSTTRRAEEAAAASEARWADRTEETENSNGLVEGAQDTRPSQSFWSARDVGKPMSPSGDLLDLSDAAKQLADSPKASTTSKAAKENAEDSAISLSQTDSNAQDAEQSSSLASSGTSGSSDLTPEEQQQISELQARDAEVRTHEAAHLAAAGQFATSGASYTYQTGPDGKKYAIGGEVSISTSPVKGDPQATLEKAQTIQRAALAPAEPSSQDQKVAAAAAQMAAKARQELTQQKATELQGSSGAEQNNALGADAEKSSSPSTNSAFQLIRKQAASTSAVTQSAASPSTYYSAQSTMSSTPSSSKGFSVYA